MLSKADYTRQILEQVPEQARIEFDYAIQAWWQDIRPDSGFIHYITLNKKLTSPYFLSLGKKPQIILFGSKEATMYSLYGDIERFVQSLSQY